METELLNKLSNLTLYGFYDPVKKMVIAHFFNDDIDKNDIIAFLNSDMSWDVREIVDEKSTLYKDKEVIEVFHKPVSVERSGSTFDKFVRKGLKELAKNAYGEDANLVELDIMHRILEENKY